ncbi:HNH endonuclease [Gordonia phage Fribs8]|nr:HNH endonuclease [Gordonia phage Fribs8]
MAWAGWAEGEDIGKTRKAQIKRRDGHRCRECGKRCKPGDGSQVDHIVNRAEGGDNSDANLQLLCGGCHDVKTRREHARGQQRRQGRSRWSRTPLGSAQGQGGTPHPGILGPR